MDDNHRFELIKRLKSIGAYDGAATPISSSLLKETISELGKQTLTLSDTERQCLEGFLEDHGDCIDSELTFEVSSDNGIGVATVVICQCGEKRDITDYGLW